ncbi:MAG: chemotaxis protein CheW [Pseudomonadota bacterium]
MSETLHLIARIADRAVAFDSNLVDSVVDLGAITPVPLAAPGVVGLAALRSRVLTVIDPRVALDLPTDGPLPSRAVITRVEQHAYAVLVDALEDVARYATVPIPAGVAFEAGWANAAQALIDRAGEPVLVIDLAALLPHAPSLAA